MGDVAVVLIALLLAACGGAGSSTTAGTADHPGGGRGDSAPPRDSFTGSIVSATGRYSGHHGRVKVYLHPHGSRRTRPTRVVLVGHCSGSSGRCIDLEGAVRGTLSPGGPRLPDVGRDFGLSGAGRLSPLGRVAISGSVSGTGFISHGHELMKLVLRSSSGSVTIQGVSGPVKGFTSP